MIAKHIIFKGRVQGVGFRYGSYRIAGGYEVTGYVRNLPDKSVEMLIQGPPAEIERCLAELRDYFSGHIRDCRINTVPVNPRHIDFRITY